MVSSQDRPNTHNHTTTLSRSELKDLRDAFALFDTEKRGEISLRELRSTLHELEQDETVTSSSSIHNLLRLASSLDDALAKNEDLLLSLEDFIQLLTTPNPADARDEIEKVFDLFDVSGKGYIDVGDLRQVAKDLGEHSLSDAELQEMIHRASSSSSSSPAEKNLTIDQFRDIMNKKHFSV